MKHRTSRIILIVVAVAFTSVFAQVPDRAGRGAGQAPGGAGRGGGRGGRGGAVDVPSVSVRGNRQVAGSAANILGWRTGIAADAFGPITFSEAAARVDALGSGYIQGFSTQRVSAELPRNLDYTLTPEDVAKVKHRLAELRMRLSAYHAGAIPADAASRRKLFDFAKELGVETIIGSAGTDAPSMAELDKLATDSGINVALDKVTAAALEGRGNRIGVHVDAPEQVSVFKDRVMAVTIRNASAPALPAMISALAQLQPPANVPWPPACGDCAAPVAPVKPLFIAIATPGGDAAVRQSIGAIAKALKPIEGARIVQISKNTPITSTEGVPPLDRLMIQATVQRLTAVAPKKPRKLLVIDLCPQGGFYHRTIAHANLWLETVAKTTNAFTPTFSNDLDNLKYPKIKEYDAVFLNSVVGPVFADPDVIAGLTRFVREGGGVAGIHGSTYASQDVPEYGEMMGATSGPHRVESKVLKVDDPNSPLTKQFEGRDIAHVDEHYHFPPTTPYTREKLHILLSVNTEKSDMTEWKTIRPDGDYGMAWIRAYGQGRVFTTPLGHTPLLLATPHLAQMVLAGTQFALGDLEADTTPSAKLGAKK